MTAESKGTVEALFTWTTRKFEHRLAGTTKATPQDRGAYDSVREAKKAGMTLDVLEELFIQAIVDGYMREWNVMRDKLRKVNPPAKQPGRFKSPLFPHPSARNKRKEC